MEAEVTNACFSKRLTASAADDAELEGVMDLSWLATGGLFLVVLFQWNLFRRGMRERNALTGLLILFMVDSEIRDYFANFFDEFIKQSNPKDKTEFFEKALIATADVAKQQEMMVVERGPEILWSAKHGDWRQNLMAKE